MGFWSFLKTSEKALDAAADLVEAGANGIDALFFTDEEKSQASMDTIKLWIEIHKTLANESTAKSITRRILAVMIMGSAMLESLFAIGIYPYNPEWSAMVIKVLASQGVMIGSVTIFYFGYYAIKQIVGKK